MTPLIASFSSKMQSDLTCRTHHNTHPFGSRAAGSIFFIALFKILLERIKGGKLLQLCCETGRNTLGIYCIQIYLLEFGLEHIAFRFNFPGAVVAQLVYAIIVLILCDALVRLVNKNKWTALFMLGRWTHKPKV